MQPGADPKRVVIEREDYGCAELPGQGCDGVDGCSGILLRRATGCTLTPRQWRSPGLVPSRVKAATRNPAARRDQHASIAAKASANPMSTRGLAVDASSVGGLTSTV